jgi:hypothetical protein
MDLWNNRVGRAIGAANPYATELETMDLVMKAFKNGELRVLRPTRSDRVPEGSPLLPSGDGTCPTTQDRGDPGVYGSKAPGSAYPDDIAPGYAYPQTPYPGPLVEPPSAPPAPPTEVPRLLWARSGLILVGRCLG